MAEKKKNKRNWEEINGRKGKRYVPRAEERSQRPVRPARPVRQEAPAAFEEMISENVIIGRNPVIEALKNDREIEKLLIGKGAEGSITKIIGMAKDKQIPIYQSDKITLDRIAAGLEIIRGSSHMLLHTVMQNLKIFTPWPEQKVRNPLSSFWTI